MTHVVTAVNTAISPDIAAQDISGTAFGSALSDLRESLSLIRLDDLAPAIRAQLERACLAEEALSRIAMSQIWPASFDSGLINLGQLLFDVQKRWSSYAQKQDYQFSLLPAADLPQCFPGERRVLEAILSNLLHHGFYHGQHRHIQLNVEIKDNDWLVFTVSGGISAHAAPGFAPTPIDAHGAQAAVNSPALSRARDLCAGLGAQLELQCAPGTVAEARFILPLNSAAQQVIDNNGPPNLASTPALHHDIKADMDKDVFTHLLELAGPELARDLVARFKEDLTTVDQQITKALPDRDLAVLRGASHVLIALAGTAGAQKLQNDARDFNALVHHTDAPNLDAAARGIQGQIVQLIQFLDGLHDTGLQVAGGQNAGAQETGAQD